MAGALFIKVHMSCGRLSAFCDVGSADSDMFFKDRGVVIMIEKHPNIEMLMDPHLPDSELVFCSDILGLKGINLHNSIQNLGS